MTVGNGNVSSTFGGTIRNTVGSLYVNKTGSGSLVLTGSASAFYFLAISQGSVQLANANALAGVQVTGVEVNNGLQFAPGIGNFTIGLLAGVGLLNLNDTAGNPITLTLGPAGIGFGAAFSGPITGSGNLVFNCPSSTLDLSGSNTFSGSTTINQGGLFLESAAALQNSTVVVNETSSLFNGLQFNSGIGFFTLGGLAGSSNLALSDNAVPPAAVLLTVGGNGASTTYTGILSSSGGLTKTGSGALTVGGANQYSGVTNVNGGTLRIGPSGSIAAASIITVSNSSTLAVTASTNLPGNVVTINPGSIFDTTGASSFSLGAGNLLTIGRPSGPGTDINGNFALGGGTLNIGGTGIVAALTEIGNLTLGGGVLSLDISSTGATTWPT